MTEKRYEVELTSRVEEVRRVEELVKKMAAENGFEPLFVYDVMLVVTEATNNAILHGNKLDASKRAFLKCRIEGDNLFVEVRDEGSGFKPEEVPNPLAEENLLKSSGRGVFLIKQMAQDVRYVFSGTGTTLTFRVAVVREPDSST